MGRKLKINILYRAFCALFVGCIVSGISLWVAWGNARRADAARPEQWLTQYELRYIAEAITNYHQKVGAMPKSMSDLEIVTNEIAYFGRPGKIRDGWKRPFILTNQGGTAVVISYGRDGKPGGKGLDSDITSKNWNSEATLPTFNQFLFEMPTRAMINICLICGTLAALLTAITIKVPDFDRSNIVVLALKLIVTTIGALIVAVVISALHVPSGH